MSEKIENEEVTEELNVDDLMTGAESATSEQDAAAFEAGFAGVRNDEEASPVATAPVQADFESAEDDGINAEEDQREEAKAALAEMTPAEIKALLDQMKEGLGSLESKVFGKIGEVSRDIQGLRKNAPQSGTLKLDPAKLTRIRELDPEFAEAIAADLNGLSAGGEGVSGIGQEEVAELLRSNADAMNKQFERKLLFIQHNDAKEVLTSNEFSEWRKSQAQDVQDSLSNSWDAMTVGKHIADFKASQKAKASEKASANRSQSERLKAMERRSQPRGSSGATQTKEEIDAFTAGFKAVRGG